MTDDYYGYHPQRIPQMPIALVGFVGAEHELVANLMSSLSGLPFHRISRIVEHREGKSVATIVRDAGLWRYRSLESEVLDQALRSSPPGIISLADSTLMDGDNRQAALDRSALVYVHFDRREIKRHLQSRFEQFGVREPWLDAEYYHKSEDLDQFLDRLYEERRESYESAPLQWDGSGKTIKVIARELVEFFAL